MITRTEGFVIPFLNTSYVNFQVVGAVAYQNRRLAIPQNVPPVLASLMEACWDE